MAKPFFVLRKGLVNRCTDLPIWPRFAKNSRRKPSPFVPVTWMTLCSVWGVQEGRRNSIIPALRYRSDTDAVITSLLPSFTFSRRQRSYESSTCLHAFILPPVGGIISVNWRVSIIVTALRGSSELPMRCRSSRRSASSFILSPGNASQLDHTAAPQSPPTRAWPSSCRRR